MIDMWIKYTVKISTLTLISFLTALIKSQFNSHKRTTNSTTKKHPKIWTITWCGRKKFSEFSDPVKMLINSFGQNLPIKKMLLHKIKIHKSFNLISETWDWFKWLKYSKKRWWIIFYIRKKKKLLKSNWIQGRWMSSKVKEFKQTF